MSTDAHVSAQPIGTFADSNCKVMAAVILHRLAETNFGGHLLVWADPEGSVFCEPANSPAAKLIERHRPRLIVGKYAYRVDRIFSPAQVVEDLECTRDELTTQPEQGPHQ